MQRITSIISACAITFGAGACDWKFVEHDGSLGRWCGDSLCEWTTEEGEIARIHTWHDHEYGVELVTAGTTISYVDTLVLSSCMRLGVVGDIEPRAQVALDIDVGVDGTLDHTQLLSAVDFERSEFVVPFAGDLGPVKFTLHKRSTGTAKIAEFRVEFDVGCEGIRVTHPSGSICVEDVECTSGACVNNQCSECGTRPCADGTECTRDDQCRSGSCVAGSCDACGAEGACGTGVACDRDDQCALGACLFNFTPSSSATTASAAQCAACREDEQCEGGYCLFGGCAACRDDADCAPGSVCGYPEDTDTTGRACIAARAEPRARGALCERDDDCANGLRCAGNDGLAPRCGVACASSSCGESGLCWAPARAIFGCSTDDCVAPVVGGHHWLIVDEGGELGRAATCYTEEEFLGALFAPSSG